MASLAPMVLLPEPDTPITIIKPGSIDIFRRASARVRSAWTLASIGRAKRAPGAAIARQQLIRRGRSLASGGIVRKVVRRMARPCVEDRLHRRPAGLDVVGALEERGIADHAVVE